MLVRRNRLTPFRRKSTRVDFCLFRLLVLAACLAPTAAGAWGLKAHRYVNETAIEMLPPPLRDFYRLHRRELSDAAVAPDVVLRKRDGEREAVRHYINLEEFGEGVALLAEMSQADAERRFGKRRVRAAGLVPWVIVDHARGIERAMRRGDWAAAIKTSGYGGHYVADATMPLHTTSNFDGQKSPAGRGLHEALEREVVDANLGAIRTSLRDRLEPPSPAPFTQGAVFHRLLALHRDVPPLIAAHVEAAKAGRVGSERYLALLERRTRRSLEKRVGDAVTAVASLWLSAWSAAGRPTPPRSLSE